MTSSTWASVTVPGRPGRGSSRRPSRRCSAKRERHFAAIPRVIDRRSAISVFLAPVAASKMMRERCANAWALLRRRAQAYASTEHPRLRLLDRRHGVAATLLRVVLHRASHAAGPRRRDHREPERDMGNPAGAQPDDRGLGLREECLDWLLILGRRQLERVLREYVEHYNHERPHRALGLRAPDPSPQVIPRHPRGRQHRTRVGERLVVDSTSAPAGM